MIAPTAAQTDGRTLPPERPRRESNPRPPTCKSCALPTELVGRVSNRRCADTVRVIRIGELTRYFLLSHERVAAWRAAASGPSRSSRLHPGHPAPPFHRKRISCGATPHHPARRVRGSSTPRPFSREGSPAGPRRLHAALRRTGRRSGRRRPPSQTLPGSAAGGCGRWAARPPLGCLAVRVAPSPPRVGWRRRLTRGSRRRWRRRTTRWRG